MNNVALSGNITGDLDLKKTQSGKSVVSFSIAINESKDKTEFVNLQAWDKTAELMAQYCQKGDRLACTGRLQTRSWEDKDTGKQVYKTEVVVEKFDFPPKRNDSNNDAQHASGNYAPTHPSQESAPVDELDSDSIPF